MPAQKVVAVIPARGGSVSIPKKNIKPLLGRPLIDWVIRAALDSGVFSEIYVSTDDNEIAAIATECGAKVHRRGAEPARSPCDLASHSAPEPHGRVTISASLACHEFLRAPTPP